MRNRRSLLLAAAGGLGSCVLAGACTTRSQQEPPAGPTPTGGDDRDAATLQDSATTADADAALNDQDAFSSVDAAIDAADEQLADATSEETDVTCDAGPGKPAPCSPAPPGLSVGLPKDYSGFGLHAFLAEELSESVLIGHDCGGFYALRAVCPHMGCTLAIPEQIWEQGVVCGCHGSAFDLLGQVTKGPAKKNLPALALALGCDGKLYVDSEQVVDKAVRLRVEEQP